MLEELTHNFFLTSNRNFLYFEQFWCKIFKNVSKNNNLLQSLGAEKLVSFDFSQNWLQNSTICLNSNEKKFVGFPIIFENVPFSTDTYDCRQNSSAPISKQSVFVDTCGSCFWLYLDINGSFSHVGICFCKHIFDGSLKICLRFSLQWI